MDARGGHDDLEASQGRHRLVLSLALQARSGDGAPSKMGQGRFVGRHGAKQAVLEGLKSQRGVNRMLRDDRGGNRAGSACKMQRTAGGSVVVGMMTETTGDHWSEICGEAIGLLLQQPK